MFLFILLYLQYVSAHNWSKVSSFSFEFFFPIFSPMYVLLLDYVFFPGTQTKTVDPTFYFLFCNLLHDGMDATITHSLCVFCKRNRNIKTYFLGSILSTASVLLTITTFQKRQMYKINIDAVWHWQYEIFFYTIKIDFLIFLKRLYSLISIEAFLNISWEFDLRLTTKSNQ